MTTAVALLSVEFVIIFPLIFGIFLTSVDLSIMMLRQVALDRALDIATRELRLGQIGEDDIDLFRESVCDNTMLTPTCLETITVELRPVEPSEFATLDRRAQCVDRQTNFAPVLEFNPGSQGQELMMVRVCTVSNPFITLNAFLLSSPRGPNDDFRSEAISVFVNEPR